MRPPCAPEGVRGYAELQSKHRATYGDDEEAREAAGKAALLRAKESLSTGWAARLATWREAVLAVRAPRLDRVACDRLADRCAATAGAARRENNAFNRKTNGHVWLSQPRTKLNSQTILCLLRTACVLLLLRVFRWAPIYGEFRPARAPL